MGRSELLELIGDFIIKTKEFIPCIKKKFIFVMHSFPELPEAVATIGNC